MMSNLKTATSPNTHSDTDDDLYCEGSDANAAENSQYWHKAIEEWSELQLDFLRRKASECGLRVEISGDGLLRVFERGGGKTLAGSHEAGVSMPEIWAKISKEPWDYDYALEILQDIPY